MPSKQEQEGVENEGEIDMEDVEQQEYYEEEDFEDGEQLEEEEVEEIHGRQGIGFWRDLTSFQIVAKRQRNGTFTFRDRRALGERGMH